jgi:hypothetical protein
MVYKSQIYYTKIGANTCYLSYLTQWLKRIVLEYDNTTSWQRFCEMKFWQIMPLDFQRNYLLKALKVKDLFAC